MRRVVLQFTGQAVRLPVVDVFAHHPPVRGFERGGGLGRGPGLVWAARRRLRLRAFEAKPSLQGALGRSRPHRVADGKFCALS